MRLGIAAGVAVALALAIVLVISQRTVGPLTVSGFIEADEIRLGSRVGGRVARVLPSEGNLVTKGDVLIELEPFDLVQRRAEAIANRDTRAAELEMLVAGYRDEEIAQAKARRDQLAAQLEKLINGPREQEIAAARAELDLAEAELDLADLNHTRTEALFGRGAATRDEMDRATSELKVARASAEVRREALGTLEEGTRREEIDVGKAQLDEAHQAWLLRVHGYRPEEIHQAETRLQAADAAVAVIDRQIEELSITAPVTSRVEALELQPGDLVTANAPVISLSDASRLWVRAYVPENRLHIKVDQKVWVEVDSFPGEQFRAHVSFVAREAEFTPGNVQTPEERSKQVFRINVTLDDGLDRLRPGMSADVVFSRE